GPCDGDSRTDPSHPAAAVSAQAARLEAETLHGSLDGVVQLAHGGKARVLLLFQAAEDDALVLRGNPGNEPARPRRVVLQLAGFFAEPTAGEGKPTRRHLEHEDAQRVHVAATVDPARPPRSLLGRHVP